MNTYTIYIIWPFTCYRNIDKRPSNTYQEYNYNLHI